jgi:ribosome biogenesis protein BRX1
VHTCQSHHHTFRCLVPSHRNLPLTPPQIIEKDPLHPSGPPQTSLVEIGPRFVLTPIRIFEGSFGGPTLFANPEFISPAAVRASVKREAGQKYRVRKEGEMDRDERRKRTREDVPEDQLARKKVFA